MTISATNASSGPFTGNGATVAFPYTFAAMETGEVAVSVNGVTISPLLYTVTRNAGDEGGTVTFITAPASDADIIIYLNASFAQSIGFSNAGAFLAASHDEAFDRSVVRDIYLNGRIDRGGLPVGTDVAGKFLAFDVDGNLTVVTGTPMSPISTEVSYENDLLTFASRERVKFSHQLRGYDEDANTSFARFVNCAPRNATSGFVVWNQRNDFFADAEQAQRCVAGDLIVNVTAKTATLGPTRLIAEDPHWDTGDPAGTGSGRGKEFSGVPLIIGPGHGSNVGNTLLLWEHLISADGRDDTGPCELDLVYAVSDSDFASPPTPLTAMTSAQAYALTGVVAPTYKGPALAAGNNIIQMPLTSAYAGRIVVALSVIRDNNWVPTLIYTDNIANGWTFGGFSVPTDNALETEASLAYDPVDDSIVVTMRLDGTVSGLPPLAISRIGRGVYRSQDGGVTLTREGINTDLALSNSATAMIQTVRDGSAKNRMLIGATAAIYSYLRDDFQIFICYDGVTPAAVYKPFPEKYNIGYCQMVMASDNYVWLLHENFEGRGYINQKNNIAITVLSLAEIILGAEML